jgi:hypothetical protein
VGKKNDLDDVIVKLTNKLREEGRDGPRSDAMRQNLVKLKGYRDKVKEIWSNFEFKPKPYPPRLYSPPMTVVEETPVDEKKMFMNFLRKKLPRMDLKLLEMSIMFIQEMESGHCIVTL